jgi:hypothetical protein
MADGPRKTGLMGLGICLATVANLSFWRLVDETGQKSAAIAHAWAALDPAIATSVQRRTGVAVIRTRCLSHTTNRAVGPS